MIFFKSKNKIKSLESKVYDLELMFNDIHQEKAFNYDKNFKDLEAKYFYLENILHDIKKENIKLKNVANLDRFYREVCSNINNNNKHLTILEKINEFYLINNLQDKHISNKDINKHISGKKGELEVLKQFMYLSQNNIFEYFYDFNLKTEKQNMQFDFLVVTNNNIYIIDVKRLNAKSIEICKSYNKYYIKSNYINNKQYYLNFDSAEKRYKLVENIVKKFEVQHPYISFNIFNILVFINNSTILLNNNYSDIINKDYNIDIPLDDNRFIQIILGKENLDNYFKKHTTKFYNENEFYENKKFLDSFMKFIKSDITFRESTDKNYITQKVHEFFTEVYKNIENENLILKFN